MPENQPESLVVINSTEWLNLIARHRVRLMRRRVTKVTQPLAPRDANRLFALAPFTKIDSSVDLFVLRISNDWASTSPRHPAATNEVSWLDVDSVISHHVVAGQNFEYYDNIAKKAGISLSPENYESVWLEWVTSESLAAAGDAAHALQECLGVVVSASSRRADKYQWSDIARLVLQPQVAVRSKPAHVESLLVGTRNIANAVAEVRDSQAFFIATTIEWIDLRLGRDPLKKKADRLLIEGALSHVRNLPLDPIDPETINALNHLAATYPRAFTDELGPLTIAGVVQTLSDHRSKRLKSSTVIMAIDRIGRESNGATLLLAVLAASLGPELTHQLVAGLATDFPMDIDWTASGD